MNQKLVLKSLMLTVAALGVMPGGYAMTRRRGGREYNTFIVNREAQTNLPQANSAPTNPPAAILEQPANQSQTNQQTETPAQQNQPPANTNGSEGANPSVGTSIEKTERDATIREYKAAGALVVKGTSVHDDKFIPKQEGVSRNWNIAYILEHDPKANQEDLDKLDEEALIKISFPYVRDAVFPKLKKLFEEEAVTFDKLGACLAEVAQESYPLMRVLFGQIESETGVSVLKFYQVVARMMRGILVKVAETSGDDETFIDGAVNGLKGDAVAQSSMQALASIFANFVALESRVGKPDDTIGSSEIKSWYDTNKSRLGEGTDMTELGKASDDILNKIGVIGG